MKDLIRQFLTHKSKRMLLSFVAVSLVFLIVLAVLPSDGPRGVLLRLVIILLLYPAAMLGAFVFASHIPGSGKAKKLQIPLAGNYTLELAGLFTAPVFICDENGRVLWQNVAMEPLWDHPSYALGKSLTELCDATYEQLSAAGAAEGYDCTVNDTPYRIHAHMFQTKGKKYLFCIWEDRSELDEVTQRAADENTLVAFIMADNLEELLQYVQEQYNSASARIEEELQKWADSCDGLLREYERNRYLLIFSASHLAAFTENRFEILDRIREIRIGDGSIPVTISVGISGRAGTLAEKERDARAALDMALQRGGDQVVLKTETGLDFYGGRNKGVQRRTKVRARVIASELASLVSRAGNVLIMMHRHADFDAFGAAVGLARLCLFCGVRMNIVADRSDPNLKKCFEKILLLPEYQHTFVSGTEAQELLDSDTLLIIADVNNATQFESPELYRSSFSSVIIDHHRKTAEFEVKPVLTYIEPSASSACELVSEILEQSLPAGSIPKEEADLMFSGILLDTKQFARNTGVRTFSAALYLRNEGANPIEVQSLFKTDLNDFIREARFSANVYLYCGVIAIAVNTADDNTSTDRIAAAKAADKLLSVEGVQASFALCRIGNSVHISARSAGAVNVQLILEKLNGGGHFDAAGAQLPEADMNAALAQLKEAIDTYLAEIRDSETKRIQEKKTQEKQES